MHGQGSYGPQFSQGSRPVAQNSYLQQSVAPSPHAPNNFQQGHLPLPSHRLPRGLPAYQQGPMASLPELQQVPHGGITNAGQSLSQPHSAVHGNTQLPHSYPTAQQNSQQPSCLSSGELLLPGLHPSEVQLPSRGLVAVSSQSQSSNGVPINHPPQQLGNVHGLRHIPPPPGPHSTSRLPADPYGSSVHSASGNSHTSSMGPVLPALEIESSMQHNHLMVAAGVHSPVDSDMEMEDDITTQSDNDLAVNQHTECPTQVCGAVSSEFDLKEQPQTPLSLAESNAGMVAPSDSMLFSSSSGLAEQESFKEPSKKDLVPTSVSSVVAVGAESMCKDSGFSLELNMGSTIPSETEKDFLSEPSISYRGAVDSQTEASIHIAQLATAEQNAANHENKFSFICDASPKVLVSKDACGGECSFNNKLQRDSEDKNASIGPKARKIDKFGRLVREGGSDSDSDDSHNARRHNKRGKSRSRSRSPVFRRRIRSPRRTRERRGRSRSSSPRNRRSRSRTPRNRRSRSRSPRNRRSRSRSPSFRRSGQLSSSNITRDRVQMTQCFDFLRGRCYRGSSCRYSHHDMERYEGSRHHRGKQQHLQLHTCLKNSSAREEIKKISSNVSDIDQKAMTKEMQPVHDMTASSIGAINDAHTAHKRKGSVNVASQHVSNEEGQLVNAEVLETKVVQERMEDYTNFASKSHVGEMESNQILMAVKTVADTAILKSCGEASQDTIQRMAASVHDPSQQAAHDSSSRLAENANTAPTTHSTRDHNLVPITAVQSLPASSESFPSYMLPNQNTLFAGTANSSWTSLPTRPPIFLPHDQNKNAGVAPAVASLPSRIDFGSQKHPRPSLNELSGDSQVYDFQRQLHHPEQESHQPLLHGEDVSFKPLPGCNASTQQSVFPSHFREDQSSEIPLQGLGSLDSFIQGSSYRQPVPFLQQELPAIKLQPFPGNSCSPGEILKSSSQNHPFLQQQQQQPPYFLRQPLSDSVHSLPGRITSSRYPPDLLDRNQPSQPHDFSTSTVSTNYNPYASTFDPISSRFGSDISRPEKVASHKCDHPLNLGCPSIDGQDVASVGSRRATSSSDSLKGIGHNPRSGDDQYDPLFDSIEPSSNSYKNFDLSQKPEPNNDSDSMLRISGSNGPLDVEETNKKEIGGINLATSLDNEGCGETTDADVGDMENASQINLNTTANIDMGEMEIDQIKSPVKSKRSKESRSLKLFKVCLAEFVKEVLKPSWRQGNMSKEAFKTVVKKTVDKVSEAMKSHHIPKSKTKINQYIDSSQLKLTKLVMGYVDKYAKG